MTSYLKNATLGVAAPLVSKDKGDISNRAKCMGSQTLNNVKTLAADTLVIGGSVATLKAAAKFGKFGSFLQKITEKGAGVATKVFSKAGLGKVSSKISTIMNKMPKGVKIAAPVVLAATALIGYFKNKNIYKAGQIDQKYTDKAKLEKHQEDII